MAGTSCATTVPAPAPQNSTHQQAKKLNSMSTLRSEKEQKPSDYPTDRKLSRAFKLVLGAESSSILKEFHPSEPSMFLRMEA